MNLLKITVWNIPCFFDGDTKVISGRGFFSNNILMIGMKIYPVINKIFGTDIKPVVRICE